MILVLQIGSSETGLKSNMVVSLESPQGDDVGEPLLD